MATAVRAHSNQNGPPFLKVAQLGLTKTKAWEGKLIRGRSRSDEIWRDREKIEARFPAVCRHPGRFPPRSLLLWKPSEDKKINCLPLSTLQFVLDLSKISEMPTANRNERYSRPAIWSVSNPLGRRGKIPTTIGSIALERFTDTCRMLTTFVASAINWNGGRVTLELLNISMSGMHDTLLPNQDQKVLASVSVLFSP